MGSSGPQICWIGLISLHIFQYDLTCERQFLVYVSQSVYEVGTLCGMLIFGWISDRYTSVWHITLQGLPCTLVAGLREFAPRAIPAHSEVKHPCHIYWHYPTSRFWGSNAQTFYGNHFFFSFYCFYYRDLGLMGWILITCNHIKPLTLFQARSETSNASSPNHSNIYLDSKCVFTKHDILHLRKVSRLPPPKKMKQLDVDVTCQYHYQMWPLTLTHLTLTDSSQ